MGNWTLKKWQWSVIFGGYTVLLIAYLTSQAFPALKAVNPSDIIGLVVNACTAIATTAAVLVALRTAADADRRAKRQASSRANLYVGMVGPLINEIRSAVSDTQAFIERGRNKLDDDSILDKLNGQLASMPKIPVEWIEALEPFPNSCAARLLSSQAEFSAVRREIEHCRNRAIKNPSLDWGAKSNDERRNAVRYWVHERMAGARDRLAQAWHEVETAHDAYMQSL